jgi:hypothetical protein
MLLMRHVNSNHFYRGANADSMEVENQRVVDKTTEVLGREVRALVLKDCPPSFSRSLQSNKIKRTIRRSKK